MRYWLTLILVLVFLGKWRFSTAADSCLSQIPKSLQDAALAQYPNFRLPQESDNHKEDIQHNRSQGGSGCAGVTAADMDGDRRKDVAMLLTEKNKDHTILVAALNKPEAWEIQNLMDMGSDRSSLYLGRVDPGYYENYEGKNQPVTEDGELPSFKSDLPGIVSGTIEASGVVFFWTPKGWRHVWVSD